MNGNSFFPVFLNISGKQVLIIGGGQVALRKCRNLASFGPNIIVIAPEITPEIPQIQNVQVKRRKANISDIHEAMQLVILATNDQSAQQMLAEECKKRKILFNRCDDPNDSDFVTGSLIAKYPITASVVTSGSPSISKMIKHRIEKILDPSLIDLAQLMNEIRPRIIKKFTNREEKETFLNRWVSENILERISREGIDSIRQEILTCL
ncbi:MAG: bifunctional precorrin-2 dehydrogenase/sirohydrochlorin ferrochelatase [Candidatus Riflebacteria bacterium]|nr:bifunctional precorrin-2 dehydrogenase/sirohydrochlorin ferrochelatase [Candidatus Riflebacteria bacterium]